MDRNFWIGVGVLVVVVLGMVFFSSVTGNVVTGSAVAMEVDDDYGLNGEVVSYVCDGSEVDCELNGGDLNG